jgi:hypothetical protein
MSWNQEVDAGDLGGSGFFEDRCDLSPISVLGLFWSSMWLNDGAQRGRPAPDFPELWHFYFLPRYGNLWLLAFAFI